MQESAVLVTDLEAFVMAGEAARLASLEVSSAARMDRQTTSRALRRMVGSDQLEKM
jgi:hypothetical protein